MRVPFSAIPAGAIFRQHQDSVDYWIKRSSRTACLYMVDGTRRAGPFYFRQGDTYHYDPNWSALEALRYHVTGAIERGEKQPILEQRP